MLCGFSVSKACDSGSGAGEWAGDDAEACGKRIRAKRAGYGGLIAGVLDDSDR